MSTITVHIADRIATITLNRPKSRNALTMDDFATLATSLREIDANPKVLITLVQATGSWFCAGGHVRGTGGFEVSDSKKYDLRDTLQSAILPTITDCSKALYSHTKILVAALNGPALGLAAALLGHFDFIYALPKAWLLCPFTMLGMTAEGGSSASFVNRMGFATANEILVLGKKKTAQELLACGFLNKVFPEQSTISFHASVQALLLDQFADLDAEAVLNMKSLIKRVMTDRSDPDAVNLRESYAQAERTATGIPARQFIRLARKEISYKL